jgi:hypothetical protein
VDLRYLHAWICTPEYQRPRGHSARSAQFDGVVGGAVDFLDAVALRVGCKSRHVVLRATEKFVQNSPAADGGAVRVGTPLEQQVQNFKHLGRKLPPGL